MRWAETRHGDWPLHPADRRHPRRRNLGRLFAEDGAGIPSFKLHKFVSEKLVERGFDYRTGVVYTTNRRVWEHDEAFRKQLQEYTPISIDMETATIFVVGHKNQIVRGALLLVSDLPMTVDGIKTSQSDAAVSRKWAERHLEIGIDSLTEIEENGEEIKHFHY